MGLATDKLFFEILHADPNLMETVGSRIYNTVIGVPELDELNEPVPYIIVMFAGLDNGTGTKDDIYEATTDNVNIEIEIAAENVEQLTELACTIRKIIHRELAYLQRYAQLRTSDGEILTDSQGHPLQVWRGSSMFEQIPYDYHFSTSDKTYVYEKPCYGMVLKYQCEVENHLYDDEQEETAEETA
jgi:hypothetical protein